MQLSMLIVMVSDSIQIVDQKKKKQKKKNDNERRYSGFVYNPLTAQRAVSNSYAQMARVQSCANHVHVGRLSRTTCRVPRDTKGQHSYLVWKSWNRICFSIKRWLKPLTHEGGEETGVLGENPRLRASEYATY